MNLIEPDPRGESRPTTAEVAESADPEAPLRKAVDLAYRHLARRDRTVAEVRAHLAAKGVEEHAIEHAVAEISEQGYLDDARYALRFTEDRTSIDGWGSDRIERRLRELGVAREDIAAALRGRDHGTELDAALQVLRRRWREPPADDREREKALGFLARKGYDLELAYDAVRELERALDG